MLTVLDIAATSLAVIFISGAIWKRRAAFARLPPSPPADFLIGHARRLPVNTGWELYAKWKKIYGDVIYTYAFGQSIVILNSFVAARDMLEQKSWSFSDRPNAPVFYLMGWELSLPILRYGPRFRKQRRMIQQYFGSQAVSSFKPMQERETHKFLHHLATTPDDFLNHMHTFVASVAVSAAYGHEVESCNDEYLDLVEHTIRLTASLSNVGTSLIDVFPSLRHVPDWLPGMDMKKTALGIREFVNKTMIIPLDELKAKRASGISPTCFVSGLLDSYEKIGAVDHDYEEDIKNIGAVVYNAGSDTTKSVLASFFLMMALHPEVAKKAQEEIENVIGRDRLPAFDDRKQLPFIDCILKELYRIHPPLPLGVPHASTRTEQYNGWSIPQGAIIIPNIWQMMRDEVSFANPEEFRPERYLDEKMTGWASCGDPSNIVFGFGRRVCPGKYFADSTLWFAMANVLALFDICPCTNAETGDVELPKREFETSVLMIQPKPFKCKITLRNGINAVGLLDEVFAA
ncbi:cytochrome P450 [Fomitiporia mediterranea MF3/22]|uniref:cytochrome P450 n=1 Tax=Fomitiporia mediterranea (strain MF3/22) TaxID=694068 RepID=UPI0004408CDF|nr:cytochrome P450 [Fomitiporia mediterranea MF3/22]EJD05107.1 cytochrome P450 [Fomitiporia mediterranea MF3/22]